MLLIPIFSIKKIFDLNFLPEDDKKELESIDDYSDDDYEEEDFDFDNDLD